MAIPRAQALSRLHMVSPTWKFCLSLPKVDLHAHLNGSLRKSTVMELVQRKRLGPRAEKIVLESNRSLAACFQLFPVLHQCVTDAETVRRVAREVVEDFASENVAYLELRTTPRAEPASRMSAEDYVDAVLHGVQDAIDAHPNAIDVGVVLSINRAMRPVEARRVLDMALHYSPITARLAPVGETALRGPSMKAPGAVQAAARSVASRSTEPYSLPVLTRTAPADAADLRRPAHEADPTIPPWGPAVVGLDFSGNPTVNSFADFRDVFEAARDAGLRTCVHFAEVEDDDDTNEVLDFGPDRVGHAIHLRLEHLRSLRQQQIPVEVCATSNARTLQLSHLATHPTLGSLLGYGHPVSVCTDDRGVFATSATRELALVADTFRLSAARVADIVLSSAHQGFMPAAVLGRVQERIARGVVEAVHDHAHAMPRHSPPNATAALRDELALHATRAAVAAAAPLRQDSAHRAEARASVPDPAAAHLGLVHRGTRAATRRWPLAPRNHDP